MYISFVDSTTKTIDGIESDGVILFRGGKAYFEHNGRQVILSLDDLVSIEGDEKFWVRCAETGDFLESFSTFEGAMKRIRDFEERDKAEGIYIEDYYDIWEEE